MKQKLFAIAVLGLLAASYTHAQIEKLYKTTKLTFNTVLITCTDGRKPSVDDKQGFVVVSCPLGRNQD